ncbi:MAG: orotidine 5'-phosphate decarboxylase, partial [Bacillota bacterium]|nr:orotidine 5'-phosphate decarboxylase [Bacillota bacterium]
VLVRTSNKGAEDIQYIKDEYGSRVYSNVGKMVSHCGEEYIGSCGYSSIGGVMGCTQVEEVLEMRRLFKSMFFLIPGYGAQGGRAEDVAMYLENGNGGIVNASRSVLLAYKKAEGGSRRFDECSRLEVLRMREEIASACERLGGGQK